MLRIVQGSARRVGRSAGLHGSQYPSLRSAPVVPSSVPYAPFSIDFAAKLLP